MIKLFGRNIIRFVILVLLQVLVLDNIQISGHIVPHFYVLFILLMPFETPNWLLLLTAFALGLSVDMFNHTLGMHAAATVFMASLSSIWFTSGFGIVKPIKNNVNRATVFICIWY